jgi:hypothetical protein
MLLLQITSAVNSIAADESEILLATSHLFPVEWESQLSRQQFSVVHDRPGLLQDRENLTFSIDVIYAGAQDGVSVAHNIINPIQEEHQLLL